MDKFKKEFINSLVLVIILFVVMILVLIAFISNANAWFTLGGQTETDSPFVNIDNVDGLGITSLTIYKIDEGNNSATRHNNPSKEELASILKLNQYDSVFPENRYHIPIIVKATLTNFKNPESVSNVTVNITLVNNTGYTVIVDNIDTNHLDLFISNLLSVSCSTDSSLSDVGIDEIEYYAIARDFFLDSNNISNNKVTKKTFVQYSNSGVSTELVNKNSTIEFDIIKPAGQSTLDVYFMLNYDENLIARFVADNDQQTDDVEGLEGYIEWGAEVEFASDLNAICFIEN